MSISGILGGRSSLLFKATNILGLGVPGWLDRKFAIKDPEGPAMGEVAVQTSQEGVARPIVWGIARPIGGNLIAVGPPVIRKIKQKAAGGKGGSKSKTTYVDAVFRTYAIRICEGPITGIRRVWRNNKLVYDGRGTAWGAKNNGTFLAKAKFYLGGWDQMPAPELQSVFGSANVPSHRGTCYMTMTNEDLTEMGGAVPQFVFEVERAEGLYLTSLPYAIECIEIAADTGGAVAAGRFANPEIYNAVESVNNSSGAVEAGVFRSTLLALNTITESVNNSSGAVEAGTFRLGLVSYNNYPIESVNNSSGAVEAGVFRVGVVSYNNYPVESVNNSSGEILNGSHGTI